MARPPKITPHDLSARLEAAGPLSASDLATVLRVDRSTVTRTLGEFGARVTSFGLTRRTRYALRRNVAGIGSDWPLYRIDGHGQAQLLGKLECYHGAWRVTWEGDAPDWEARFADGEGIWKGFPFFLGDLRPSGFMSGTAEMTLSYQGYIHATGDDHTLLALATAGMDLPGDLVLGDPCLRQALALGISPGNALPPHQAITRYPEFAARAGEGQPGGGRVGGRQPKFLASLSESGVGQRQVLVKFSPPMVQGPGRRWADLLAMEWHALSLLAELGLAQGDSRLIDAGGRRFLEVTRFDRTPEGGRSGVISLEALHAAAIGGVPADWTARVMDLQRAGLVDEVALRDTRRLQAFGELIGNSDMHSGNLAFQMTHSLPFTLAPAYGMLPMLWAPNSQGELIERNFAPQPPVPDSAEAWREMMGLAREFWNRVIADPRVSREFAATARANGEVLARLAERFC